MKNKKNRLFFLIAATRAENEFWHFSYGDRYAAYWKNENPEDRVAVYGAQ